MTDKRPYCVKCDTRMYVDLNEVKIRYNKTQIQYGDRYKCPECGNRIIIGFGEPMDGEINE